MIATTITFEGDNTISYRTITILPNGSQINEIKNIPLPGFAVDVSISAQGKETQNLKMLQGCNLAGVECFTLSIKHDINPMAYFQKEALTIRDTSKITLSKSDSALGVFACSFVHAYVDAKGYPVTYSFPVCIPYGYDLYVVDRNGLWIKVDAKTALTLDLMPKEVFCLKTQEVSLLEEMTIKQAYVYWDENDSNVGKSFKQMYLLFKAIKGFAFEGEEKVLFEFGQKVLDKLISSERSEAISVLGIDTKLSASNLAIALSLIEPFLNGFTIRQENAWMICDEWANSLSGQDLQDYLNGNLDNFKDEAIGTDLLIIFSEVMGRIKKGVTHAYVTEKLLKHAGEVLSDGAVVVLIDSALGVEGFSYKKLVQDIASEQKWEVEL